MHQKIIIQEAAFQMQEEYQALQSAAGGVGAVAIFTGIVRGINAGSDNTGSDNHGSNHHGTEVRGLYVEHYPGMTEREIGKILASAESRWQLLAATVIHRVGALAPGEEIVLVGTAAGHRGDALAACAFVIDYLKTRATIWKKEQTREGEAWLTTRDTDLARAAAWKE